MNYWYMQNITVNEKKPDLKWYILCDFTCIIFCKRQH